MVLNIIGIGLDNEKDISLKGLELIKKSEVLYLEGYTSILNVPVDKLEKFYGKEIILADRNLVENNSEKTILKNAKEKEVSYLVVGDPFSATTHFDLVERAKKEGIKIRTINNVSVFNAIGRTGLQLYKFGKTTSIPYPEPNFKPKTAYDVIELNKKNGLHSLILLDIKSNLKDKYEMPYKQGKFMTIKEALNILLDLESYEKREIITKETKIIGCARLTASNEKIVYGTVKELLNVDFGAPLHCLIFPGKLHFIEEEVLEKFKI